MTEEYKYWFFYIKPQYKDSVYLEDPKSLLYAYTDNKEYTKLFKQQRDLNKFHIKKEIIDKETVNYLAQNFQRSYLILKTSNTKSQGIGSKIIEISLVITTSEDQIIQSNISKILMVDLWKCSTVNPYVFKEKYLNILNILGLRDRYDTMNTWTRGDDIDRIGKNVYPDFVSAFIATYGFLLKQKDGK